MTRVHIGEEGAETQRYDRMKMEAETGVMSPQAKEFWELLDARRGNERLSLKPSEETLISGSGLQNSKRINFYCFKPLSLWSFSMAALEN